MSEQINQSLGDAHDEPVEVSPIPGTDDLRVSGLSADHLTTELHPDHDVILRDDPPSRYASLLSEREVDVLRLIAAGKSNDEVADALFLSINTVKSHIRLAYRKIRVESRSQAVAWAVRQGLADEPVEKG